MRHVCCAAVLLFCLKVVALQAPAQTVSPTPAPTQSVSTTSGPTTVYTLPPDKLEKSKALRRARQDAVHRHGLVVRRIAGHTLPGDRREVSRLGGARVQLQGHSNPRGGHWRGRDLAGRNGPALVREKIPPREQRSLLYSALLARRLTLLHNPLSPLLVTTLVSGPDHRPSAPAHNRPAELAPRRLRAQHQSAIRALRARVGIMVLGPGQGRDHRPDSGHNSSLAHDLDHPQEPNALVVLLLADRFAYSWVRLRDKPGCHRSPVQQVRTSGQEQPTVGRGDPEGHATGRARYPPRAHVPDEGKRESYDS